MTRRLDLVCIGRAAVDLYGEQIGAQLQDVSTFARYLGGSPANTAVGCARLGLRPAMLARVGDEQNGEFVRNELARAGVDVSRVIADASHLTALVFLSIRDQHTFPLLFYRDRCADMALTTDDIDEALIASARALLVSGTHLSQESTRAACRKAIASAIAAETQVILDIDFRPVLWGLRPLGDGATRYVESSMVTTILHEFLPSCDLIVGTEEEFAIAGGSARLEDAVEAVRGMTRGVLVVKRGADGCTILPGSDQSAAPALTVPGAPIEVFNVLGAGDAFMAGFLSGWLRDRPLVECGERANACGALVVSRHGCAPAMPTGAELDHFLAHGSPTPRLREDAVLNRLHRAGTRDAVAPLLAILAFDHRAQFEAMAEQHGQPATRIVEFKRLIARGALRALDAQPGRASAGGLIIDDRYGESLLPQLDDRFWIARPVESPGQRPLAFEDGENVLALLRRWPRRHVAKCLVSFNPDDPPALRGAQIERLLELNAACMATDRELLLEIVLPFEPADGQVDRRLRAAMSEIAAAGVLPDWWKLPAPVDEDGWGALSKTVHSLDPHCRGVLVLGQDAPLAELAPKIALAARHPICRGFAVGRTIFGEAARAWFAGAIDDAATVDEIAARYSTLIELLFDSNAAAASATPAKTAHLQSTH